MKKTILLLAAAAIPVMFSATGCFRAEAPAKKGGAPVPVLAAKAVTTNLPVQLAAIGNVAAYSKVTVRAQITGQLQETHFKEGQEVKKGDRLFSLDPRPAQAALARDKAQLQNAEAQFARQQKLFDQKMVSQDEYETAKANHDTLAAAVRTDELNLGYCEILAPVDGVVGAQLVYPGNIIKAEDDEMVVLNQIHPIQVAFAVPEQHLAAIKKEMARRTLAVEASFAGMAGSAPAGELTFVDNAVDMTTGMIQLKATFPNADNQLWPGQFVQVRLTLAEIADAIIVPSHAVQTGQKGEYVFVVKPDQTVELRLVKVGENFDGMTTIVSGLTVGETVVTDGQLRLVSGAKVNVKSE